MLGALAPGTPAAQSEAPSAAIASVGVVGEISESRRVILYNQLQASLSQSYRLTPREAFEEAEQRAFRELKFHECVLEPCLRKVQDFLQTERLFFLQVVREDELTQLTLTLIRPSDKIVRAYNCQACEIAHLGGKVAALATATIAADLGDVPPAETSKLIIRVDPAGAVVEVDGELRGSGPEVGAELAPGQHRVRVTHPGGKHVAQERDVEIRSYEQKDIFFTLETGEAVLARREAAEARSRWKTKWGWALGLGIAAGLFAFTEAEQLDESNDRQNAILRDMEGITSWNEYAALRSRLASEEQAAKEHEENANLGLVLSALLLGTAGWVYFDPPPEAAAVALLPSFHASGGPGLTLVVRW
jgi:hypothetical protein